MHEAARPLQQILQIANCKDCFSSSPHVHMRRSAHAFICGALCILRAHHAYDGLRLQRELENRILALKLDPEQFAPILDDLGVKRLEVALMFKFNTTNTFSIAQTLLTHYAQAHLDAGSATHF